MKEKIFTYNDKKNSKILITPSAIKEERFTYYNQLFDKLKKLGFSIFIKEHNYQGSKKKLWGQGDNFPQIKSVNKIKGN